MNNKDKNKEIILLLSAFVDEFPELTFSELMIELCAVHPVFCENSEEDNGLYWKNEEDLSSEELSRRIQLASLRLYSKHLPIQ